MRHLSMFVAVAIAGSACQYAEQPAKVAALEKRVEALASQVEELTGDPEGEGDDAEGDKKADKKSDKKSDKKADPRSAARPDKKADPKGAKLADKAGKADKKDLHDDHVKPVHDDVDEPPDEPAAAEPAAPVPEVAANPHAHWTYEGTEGPEAWGDLDPTFASCATGEAQSPVDILPQRGVAPEVFFIYQPVAGTIVDNGHTLQVDLDRGSYAIVDGARYDLVQFHIHTPSEHTIAGDHLPLELHLVHKSKAGKLAVVAVLFDAGEASRILAPMWKAAPKAKGTAKLKKPIDVDALLPVDRTAYRYDGSLTTPPCTEGVRWIVLKRTRSEDPARIAAFTARFGANARPVQELGQRTVR